MVGMSPKYLPSWKTLPGFPLHRADSERLLRLHKTEFRSMGEKTSILILKLPHICHRPSAKALKCSIPQ